MNEIGKQFTPDFLIYWKELGEIRKARYEQKQLKGDEKKVFLDEKMRNLKRLTKDEEDYYQTDPEKADTDGDGYLDGQEVKNGYNPNGPGKLESNSADDTLEI